MKLIPLLQLSPGREALCLVGGGGKTTLLYRLAHEALETGSVCVTTSTHIALPSAEQALYVQTFDEQAFLQGLQQQKVLCIGSLTDLRDEAGVQKLSMAPEPWLAFAQSHTDWLFCEADGARHFPAKVPNETEPVLLPGSAVLAVFGLSAIGKPLQEVCFRAPLALSLLGTKDSREPLTVSQAARLLTSPLGQRKGVPEDRFYRVFLNQADDENGLALARQLAASIHEILPGALVAAGSLQKGVYHLC